MSNPQAPSVRLSTATTIVVEPSFELNDCPKCEEQSPSPTAEKTLGNAAPAHDPPPDGGLRAWLVVVGAMCNAFATFGLVNSWGVFQTYYEKDLLNGTSTSQIAWIGSIQYSLVFLPGIIIGRLFDLGYHKGPLRVASLLLIATTFITAECTQYWHFVLCQGIALGMGCGIIFPPTISIVQHWFFHKRGLVMGLVAVGSSIGGTIFPIIARNLIDAVGFKWTMRIIGFIVTAALTVANLTLKRRLPPTLASGGLINFAAFKSPAFSIYCASGAVVFLGLYTTLTYIDVAAVTVGISPDFSFYLVSIANASSGVGRLASGLAADRWGVMNIMIPMTTLAAIFTYAWPFARTEASLVIIAVLYGISSGAYLSLLNLPLMSMGTADVGQRVGVFMTILSAGALVGPPISGAISSAHGFEAVGYYAGSVILFAVVLVGISRRLMLGKMWGKI